MSVSGLVIETGAGQLADVIHALRATRRLARSLRRRQQQRDEDADHGDDDE